MKTRAILLVLALSLASNASAAGRVTAMHPVYSGMGNWMLPAPPVSGFAPIYYGIGNRGDLNVRMYHANRKRAFRAERARYRVWLRSQSSN